MESPDLVAPRVVIVAGGRSSRMGEDKASLTVDGETLLARTVRIAATIVPGAALIVGRERPTDWEGNLAVEFVSDEQPNSGPLGGLLTASRIVGGAPMIALSCDLPALTGEALSWLIAQPRGVYGTITRTGEQLQPLFAVYTPAADALIEANLARGKRSLHALIAAGGEGFAIADASPSVVEALVNVNTPEEWESFIASRRSARAPVAE